MSFYGYNQTAESVKMQGNDRFNSQDYEGAISYYTRAIEIDPKYAAAYYNRGMAKIKMGQKENACIDFTKAGELGNEKAYEMIKLYCQPSNENNGSEQSWGKIDNNTYSIAYPNTWFNQGGQYGAHFYLFPVFPKRSDFNENISLMTEYAGSYNLSAYVSVSIENLQKTLANYHVIESKTEIGKSGIYQRIISSGTVGNLKLKWLQYIFVNEGTAYALTFTSQIDDFNSLIEVPTKIMNTFLIK